VPAGGGMVKEAWFGRYRPDQRPETFDQIVQSWDTANKPSELADYSVCTTGASRDRTFVSSTFCARSSPFPTSMSTYTHVGLIYSWCNLSSCNGIIRARSK
jgi:hypothetical protein